MCRLHSPLKWVCDWQPLRNTKCSVFLGHSSSFLSPAGVKITVRIQAMPTTLANETLPGSPFSVPTSNSLVAKGVLFHLPALCSCQCLADSTCSVNVCWRSAVSWWLSRFKCLGAYFCCGMKCMQVNLVQTAYVRAKSFSDISMLRNLKCFQNEQEVWFFSPLNKVVLVSLYWNKSPRGRPLCFVLVYKHRHHSSLFLPLSPPSTLGKTLVASHLGFYSSPLNALPPFTPSILL